MNNRYEIYLNSTRNQSVSNVKKKSSAQARKFQNATVSGSKKFRNIPISLQIAVENTTCAYCDI